MKILSLFNKTTLPGTIYKNSYDWEAWLDMGKVDLLLCVGNIELFEAVLADVEPTYYILETIKPYKQSVSLNAALVSAQSRFRWYHTNIDFEYPKDREIMLSDKIGNPISREDNIIMNKKKLWLQNKHTYEGRTKSCEIGIDLPYNVYIKDDDIRVYTEAEIAELQGFPKYEKGIETSIHNDVLMEIIKDVKIFNSTDN